MKPLHWGKPGAVGVGRGCVWPTRVRGKGRPAGREGCPGQGSHVVGPFPLKRPVPFLCHHVETRHLPLGRRYDYL